MKKVLLCWLCVTTSLPTTKHNLGTIRPLFRFANDLQICPNEAQLYITTCARRKALAWIFMEVRGHPTQGAPRKRAGSGTDSQLCFGERASLVFFVTKGTAEGKTSASSASLLEYIYI